MFLNQIFNSPLNAWGYVVNITFLVIGIFLLVKGADFFVDGASSFAKKLKIPAIVIGLIYVVAGLLGNTAISLVIDFLKNDYESLIAPVTVLVGTIFKQFLTNGIFTLIPGIALCVVGFVFKAKKSE